MEHILQFGISIDDEAIKKSIASKVEREIINHICSDMEKELFRMSYGGSNIQGLSYQGEQIVKDWLESHSDVIIEKTVESLCNYLKRTKAIKEAVKSVLEDN